MTKEAQTIRKMINELEARLLELEGVNGDTDGETDLCTSTVCGHDEIIANLRRLSRTYGHDGRMTLAAWEHVARTDRPRWYSTTMDPGALQYLLQDPNVVRAFLEPLLLTGALEALWRLYDARQSGADSASLDGIPGKAVEALVRHGYVSHCGSDRYALSLAGWQSFCVLAHLSWAMTAKVGPEKSMRIAEALQALYGFKWGNYLGIDCELVIEDLTTQGWTQRLSCDGITEKEIRTVIHEHNDPKLRTQNDGERTR